MLPSSTVLYCALVYEVHKNALLYDVVHKHVVSAAAALTLPHHKADGTYYRVALLE